MQTSVCSPRMEPAATAGETDAFFAVQDLFTGDLFTDSFYTSGPRPTHGGYPPTALHQPANHPQTNNSAYPRALKRGGRRRRTPPTTTTVGNTSTRTQTIKAGQLTLLNLSPPRHPNYTTPPPHHHRGLLPPGAATPPIPLYPWFPQQRWSRLEWAQGIGSAILRPPLRRDAVGLRRAATPHLAR